VNPTSFTILNLLDITKVLIINFHATNEISRNQFGLFCSKCVWCVTVLIDYDLLLMVQEYDLWK
jgi:hypothetical protein